MNAQTGVGERSDDALGPLGLGSILPGSLPKTLLTGNAPERYEVEAVFTRRPEQAEVKAILGDETYRFLRERGYRETSVTISDRRMVIANTSLDELRDGLAAVLAERLVAVSAAAQSERRSAAAQ